MSASINEFNRHSQTTEAFQQSEKLFRALIENSSDALALVSDEGVFTYVSPSVQKILGFTPEELLGCRAVNLLPPEHKSIALERFETVNTTPGLTVTVEHPYLHKDGSLRWVESTTTNQLHNPTIQAFVANFRDITERKHTEEQRRTSEARKGAIIETALDCIIAMDHQGRVIEFNPAAEHTFGYRRADVLGREMAELIIPPALRERHRQGLKQYLKTGEGSLLGKRIEIEAVRADGTEFPVELSITQVSSDVPPTFIGYLRDITERKQSEEELRKAKEQFEAILHNAADGITVQDASGSIVYVNDVAATLSGFPSAEAMLNAPPDTLRQAIQRFVMKDEGGNLLPVDELPGRRALRGEKNVQALIQYVDTLTGQTRWSLVKSQPIFDEDGHAQFIVNVVTDISERQALEQRKDEFISMASHELKTPVTSIKGFTQILHSRFKKRGDEESLRFLNIMNEQLNKLTRLISDLLDISKMQAGKLTFQEDFFDLSLLVQETVENLQAATSTHQLQLDGLQHVQVFGDKDRLGQVLVNLLTNAIKYSPQADTVIVRVAADSENAIVSVQDFGIGIPKGHQDKIFERFYQVTDPEEKTFPGLGIGLYISSEIVKRHKGRMWVESTKGEGSIFSFTVPLRERKEISL